MKRSRSDADKNTQAAADLAAGATPTRQRGSVNQLSQDRTRAETNEGSIQVAASLALNILSNKSLATVGGGIAVTATDKVACARQRYGRHHLRNASATNPHRRGRAVAINYVRYQNKAKIGRVHPPRKSLLVKRTSWRRTIKRPLRRS
jgi:hypothetical protein